MTRILKLLTVRNTGVLSLIAMLLFAAAHNASTDVAVFGTGLILLLNMPEPRK